jgi:hypothetical protein
MHTEMLIKLDAAALMCESRGSLGEDAHVYVSPGKD